jgi:phosphoglucomutase
VVNVSAVLPEAGLSIAADFNGSARTLSIDREFFASLGIKLYAMNDKPGEIRHRIVPEGESLEPCRRFLEECHRQDRQTVLGYVCDCDGDRGNLVFWDGSAARPLEAQEVFALACLGELAHLAAAGLLGNAASKVAVAINGPTSMRIDRIAEAFGVSVFRAEVGEANVVNLARSLREKGYLVRFLGEGAAGGTIIHPSAVRDPLDTVMAIVKLLTLRGGQAAGGKQGLFEIWCAVSGRTEQYRADFTLNDIIASLPAFVTTGAYSDDALLKIQTTDHAALKNRYETIFRREWERRKARLEAEYGITGWRASAFIGAQEIPDVFPFGKAGRGGLKIRFTNRRNRAVSGIWMRGSGTEPVFRVMADVEGTDRPGAARTQEQELIAWQRDMVIEADRG